MSPLVDLSSMRKRPSSTVLSQEETEAAKGRKKRGGAGRDCREAAVGVGLHNMDVTLAVALLLRDRNEIMCVKP